MAANLVQDSLIQTVRQVQAAFEALLDILELQSQLEADTQAAAADNQSFLHSIAATLLAIGELQQKLQYHADYVLLLNVLTYFLHIVDIYHGKPCNFSAVVHCWAEVICLTAAAAVLCFSCPCCVSEVHFLDMQAIVCIFCSQSMLLSSMSFLAVSQPYHCLIRIYHLGAVGSHRKGRYIPLAALVRRVGANQMLSMQSDLLKQVHICLPCHAYAPACITSLHLHAEFDLLCVNSVACRARLAV